MNYGRIKDLLIERQQSKCRLDPKDRSIPLLHESIGNSGIGLTKIIISNLDEIDK